RDPRARPGCGAQGRRHGRAPVHGRLPAARRAVRSRLPDARSRAAAALRVAVHADGVAVQLSARQRTALSAICDTFFPAENGTPAASDLGVVDALVEAVALNPRAAERKQLQQLLSLWDTAPLTALGGGGFSKFSGLSQEERE